MSVQDSLPGQTDGVRVDSQQRRYACSKACVVHVRDHVADEEHGATRTALWVSLRTCRETHQRFATLIA